METNPLNVYRTGCTEATRAAHSLLCFLLFPDIRFPGALCPSACRGDFPEGGVPCGLPVAGSGLGSSSLLSQSLCRHPPQPVCTLCLSIVAVARSKCTVCEMLEHMVSRRHFSLYNNIPIILYIDLSRTEAVVTRRLSFVLYHSR